MLISSAAGLIVGRRAYKDSIRSSSLTNDFRKLISDDSRSAISNLHTLVLSSHGQRGKRAHNDMICLCAGHDRSFYQFRQIEMSAIDFQRSRRFKRRFKGEKVVRSLSAFQSSSEEAEEDVQLDDGSVCVVCALLHAWTL